MRTEIELEAAAREESNRALIEVLRAGELNDRQSDWNLEIVNDPDHGTWIAYLGDEKIGDITYRYVGGRVVLITTWVNPAYRSHHVATALIGRALDEVRAAGDKITIICPVVGEFIAAHPEYADLIDPRHPGVGAYPTHGA